MQRVCSHCAKSFEFSEEDRILLEKLSPVYNDITYPLPPPTHCPSCRYQRRLALRNESRLYRRKCDFTGDDIVSLYPPESPYTVYKEEIWWSDEWDPLDYGRDIDFSRPFFEQFNELRLAVPRRGMQQDGTAENSEYSTYGMGNRNCYMAFACALSEDVYYSTWCLAANNCTDCLTCYKSELLYECINCQNSYQSFYSLECTNIQDSYFLKDCINCHHCISCKNLRGKSYHIYNQPVSKEEYEHKKAELHAGGFEAERKKYDAWQRTVPTLYAHIVRSEDCTGDSLENAHNCKDCFDIILGGEDMRYCQFGGWMGKDMMDCSNAGKEAELMYEVMATITSQHVLFTMNCQTSSNIMYCEGIKHCDNCFGCIGMNHKKFCILNKQYSEEEFYALIPQLVDLMKEHNEWGENVPIAISAFGYNETLANERFPMSREDVLAEGWKWCDIEEVIPEVEKVIPAEKLPETIAAVPDDILNWAIRCQETKRPYRIIAQELSFYRRMNLPLPRLHPKVRHKRRALQRSPHFLWKRHCEQCGATIETPYSPNTPDILYCEKCYLAETYGGSSERGLERAVHGAKTKYKNLTQRANTAKLFLRATAKKKD